MKRVLSFTTLILLLMTLLTEGRSVIRCELYKEIFGRHRNGLFSFYDGCMSKEDKFNLRKHLLDFSKVKVLFFSEQHYMAPPAHNHVHWLIADGVNCNLTQYLHQVNMNGYYLTAKHLVVIDPKDYGYYTKYLAVMNILPASEFLLGVERTGHISLNYLYKIIKNGDLIIEGYGVWSEPTGLRITHPDKDMALERRKNFRKNPIKTGNVVFEDKAIIKSNFEDIPETPDSFFQQDMPILLALLQSLNATMQLTVYDYHGYGAINQSAGKIIMDGMIGDLVNEKIDIASTMYLTPDRIMLFRPLSPIDFWDVKFFLKRPSLSYVKNIYILTLSGYVWIATAVMFLLFWVVVYIALKLEVEDLLKFQENITRGSVRRITVSDTILLCFEALCQQGTLIEPVRLAGRLTLLLLFLLFMFIYVAYSAGILVLLKSTANLNSLNDLLESRYEVGGLNQSYIKYYFQSPKSGVLRELYLKKIGSDSYFEASCGLNKVQEGNFAFFAPVVASYKYFLKNFTNYDICTLQELAGYMNMKSYPAVPKNSGYKEIFKIGLLRLRENGIAKRSKERVVRKPQCNNQAGIFQSVRIVDCLYVILIFIYGTLMALLLLVLECALRRFKTKN